MRTLQIILGTGVAVALMGLNVAVADIKNLSSSTPITFPLDLGDGAVVLDISFGLTGGTGPDGAEPTCMMTPGGPATDVLLELPPIVPVSNPNYLSTPQATLEPINSLNSPPPYYPERGPGGPSGPAAPIDPMEPGSPTPIVPAPATLLIVGLGLAGIAMLRRRKRG